MKLETCGIILFLWSSDLEKPSFCKFSTSQWLLWRFIKPEKHAYHP